MFIIFVSVLTKNGRKMKIAIPCVQPSASALVDDRFGRCAYFAFYDEETQQTTFVENPASQSNEGAGPAAAQFVVSQGAEAVAARQLGPKVTSLLQSLSVRFIELNEADLTIDRVIGLF